MTLASLSLADWALIAGASWSILAAVGTTGYAFAVARLKRLARRAAVTDLRGHWAYPPPPPPSEATPVWFCSDGPWRTDAEAAVWMRPAVEPISLTDLDADWLDVWPVDGLSDDEVYVRFNRIVGAA